MGIGFPFRQSGQDKKEKRVTPVSDPLTSWTRAILRLGAVLAALAVLWVIGRFRK